MRLLSLRPHRSRDFEIRSCHQHAFLFCWGEFALALFLGNALKILNNLKHKQTLFHTNHFFFLTSTIKLPNLDWTFYVIKINILLVKYKLINFDWIVNNFIVPKLLINYLNLIKESIKKQLLTVQMFFEIDFLINFAIFRGKQLIECF